jgi:hypothetical protein
MTVSEDLLNRVYIFILDLIWKWHDLEMATDIFQVKFSPAAVVVVTVTVTDVSSVIIKLVFCRSGWVQWARQGLHMIKRSPQHQHWSVVKDSDRPGQASNWGTSKDKACPIPNWDKQQNINILLNSSVTGEIKFRCCWLVPKNRAR